MQRGEEKCWSFLLQMVLPQGTAPGSSGVPGRWHEESPDFCPGGLPWRGEVCT